MISAHAIDEAAQRIAGLVRVTPCLRLFELEEQRPLWAKCENLQAIGAFKARGAMNAVSKLSADERARGLITYSSGNHAQAVARAAVHFGVPADIAMPENAPAIKVASVRSMGATIHFSGTTSPERKAKAEELRDATGGTIIEPFDDDDIIAGQGTATREFLHQLEVAGAVIDTLLVPVGGGGLIAGACIACGDRDIDIIAVEPEGCDAMGQSLAAGKRVGVPPGDSIADGLKPTFVGERNFEIAAKRVSRAMTVSDEQIGRALVALLFRCRLLVEPSAAAVLAAAAALEGEGRGIGMLFSGGNVSPHVVTKLIDDHGVVLST